MIRKNILFGFLIISSLIWSCAPKASKTKVDNYYEDLSAYRPEVPSVEIDNTNPEETSTGEVERGNYVSPKYDITTKLNSVLDSVAHDNLERRVTYYSIQVYTGISREEANEARQKVYRILGDASPRLEYNQPNYKVKVGMFNDRLEAHKTFTQLQKAFPTALLVPERRYLN